MEPNSDQPPFWSPPPPMRRRRSSSPPFISLPVLIILLPTLALIILFFAIRPLLSLTPQVFRPSSVKKSWDSFNVFLVLFAIICGIFARRNADVPTAADVGDSRGSDRRTVDAAGVKVNGDSEFPQQWFGFTERRFSDPAGRTPGTARTTRLRRNSSYPDLRQESPWEIGNDGNHFRFFDDFEINKFRSRSFEYRTRGSEIEESPAEIKVIPVDSFVANSSPVPQRMKSPNPNPPPPPPLPVTQRKSRRTYQTIQKEEVQEVSTNNAEFAKSQSPPPPPPLPPRTVIPPSPVRVRLEERFGKNERKKTNVKKEIKMALASLYRMRKKKQKAKNIYNGDSRSPTHQRPPPPPPPPPPSVFRIFKKSSKNKRVHSESTPPPPPPPPPVSSSSRSTKNKIQIPPPPSPPPPPSSRARNSTANRRPPLPARVHNSYVENESINRVPQNPSVTIPSPPPPPPPPPPTTDIKCVVLGDTIEPRSSETSRCGSPGPENVDSSSIPTTEPTVGGMGAVFCPSPDVNIKAANFIARLRGEWRLEKMNSVREKERLGQGPNYEIMAGQGPNVRD